MRKQKKKSLRYRRRLFEQKVFGFTVTALTVLIAFLLFTLFPTMPKDCTVFVMPAVMGVYMMLSPKLLEDELDFYDEVR